MRTLYDMKLRIFRSELQGYKVDIRLWDGGRATNALSSFRIDDLRRIKDPQKYGSQLFDWLFQGECREALRYVQKLSGMKPKKRLHPSETSIRFRLELDPQLERGVETTARPRFDWETTSDEAGMSYAPEADQRWAGARHPVHWESMFDPVFKAPLSLMTAFSRFVRVRMPGGRFIQERPLRMLTAISNPSDAASIDLEAIVTKASTRSWGEYVAMDALNGALTLNQIHDAVARQGYHFLHLLAPVETEDGRSLFVLSDDTGAAQLTPCDEVVEALAPKPEQAPFLVFLSTLPASGPQGSQTMTRIAPMLIRAGVQAVVVTQSAMPESHLLRFTDRFYATLLKSGVIDVAMRDARLAIYEQDAWDWTTPILFTGTPDTQFFQPLPGGLEEKLYKFGSKTSKGGR